MLHEVSLLMKAGLCRLRGDIDSNNEQWGVLMYVLTDEDEECP